MTKDYYGIEVSPRFNAGLRRDTRRKKVEVKTTQGAAVALSNHPEHLLVLKLMTDGSFEDHYNEPGQPRRDLLKEQKPTKNGQQQVRSTMLSSLMSGMDAAQLLEPIRPLPDGAVRAPSAPT